jgi:hypothetical protein
MELNREGDYEKSMCILGAAICIPNDRWDW